MSADDRLEGRAAARSIHQQPDQLPYAIAALIMHGCVEEEGRMQPDADRILGRSLADLERLDLAAVVLMLARHHLRHLPGQGRRWQGVHRARARR